MIVFHIYIIYLQRSVKFFKKIDFSFIFQVESLKFFLILYIYCYKPNPVALGKSLVNLIKSISLLVGQ